MNVKVLLLKLLSTLGWINSNNEYTPDVCRNDSNYKYMSSKTSYDLVANKTNFKEFSLHTCKQVGVWHLSRHGQRFPDVDDIIEMNEVLPKLKNLILNSSILFFN